MAWSSSETSLRIITHDFQLAVRPVVECVCSRCGCLLAPAWLGVICVWCRVIPTSEGCQMNSDPLQFVNTWLRHMILADQWSAFRLCCNWLALSTTVNVIYCDRPHVGVGGGGFQFPVWFKCAVFDVFLIRFSLLSSSSRITQEGILTMSLGSILNE